MNSFPGLPLVRPFGHVRTPPPRPRVARALVAGGAAALLVLTASAEAASHRVIVTVENLAPTNGTFQTPHWVAFHDGEFDIYDGGTPADNDPVPNDPRRSVERLAEDGNTAPISETFAELKPGGVDGTIPGPDGALGPGEVTSASFVIDSHDPSQRYFSYASMLLPSNDFWYANGNPLAHPVFDDNGEFVARDFIVSNTDVLDAGTEVNDEVPASTAFFGQQVPDTGVDENGVILDFLDADGSAQLGFLPKGSGGILDDPRFAMADFTLEGYPLAKISFSAAPAVLEDRRFVTKLDGKSEVPPVRTKAYGFAEYHYDGAKGRIAFAHLLSLPTRRITAAHLHLGAEGENGPVIATLYEGTAHGDTLGWPRGKERLLYASRLVGELVSGDLEGPLQGRPIDVLVTAIEAGDVYVNVHTRAHPDGKVRGQLRLKGDGASY